MASRRAPPPVPRGSPAASDKKYVKATWDYKANEAGELSFTVGDIISVVSEDGSGWWIGESNGMKGQFPVNFTEPCAAPAVVEKPPIAPKPTKLVPVQAEQPKPVAAIPIGGGGGGGGGDPMAELRAKLANRSTIAPGEMAPIKKEPIQLKPVAKSAEDVPTPTASGPSRAVKDSARVVQSVIANKPPVIQRAPAVGANNNNTTNNVPNVSQLKPIRPLVRTTPDNPNPNATPAPPVSPRSVALRKSEQIPLRSTPDPIPSPAIQDEPQVEKATVLFDYAATSETEISFATGDVIIIIEKNDSGWWKGKIDDSTEGWFPSDFVELLGEKEPSIEERLAEVGSKEPRLATPKRAMGKAGRRPPTRGKKAGSAVKSVKSETADAPADLKGRSTVIGMAPIRLDDAMKAKIKNSPLGSSNSNVESPSSPKSGPLRSPLSRREPRDDRQSTSSSEVEEPKEPNRLVALKKREPTSSPSPTSVDDKPAADKPDQPTRLVALKKREPTSTSTEEKPPVATPSTEKPEKPAPTPATDPSPSVAEKVVARTSKPDLSASPRKVASPSTSADAKPTSAPLNKVNNNNNNNNNVAIIAGNDDHNPMDDIPLPGNLGDFKHFKSSLLDLFTSCKNKNVAGELHPNPILQKSNPSSFGVCFRSISGHTLSFGDSLTPFCLHNAINPLLYAIAHSNLGNAKVANVIGDSKNVNENFGFDGKKASNLTTDAGGLLLSSQLFTNEEAAMRCYQIQQILSQMVGPRGVGFDLPTYLSSHSSNDELFAVAYTMGSQNVMGKAKPVKETIDFTLQLRSITLNCELGAAIAASFAKSANDGPISGNSVTATVNALKRVGSLPVPCITSISGALMVILPNIGGLCIYSPVLNNNMIGAKSLELCNSFLEKFNIK